AAGGAEHWAIEPASAGYGPEHVTELQPVEHGFYYVTGIHVAALAEAPGIDLFAGPLVHPNFQRQHAATFSGAGIPQSFRAERATRGDHQQNRSLAFL